MKHIYILLTRSETAVSRAIHNSTGAAYTHASLAYDQELQTLTSFARHYPRLPLPAGLIRENLQGGYYALHTDIPCLLLALPVTEEAHDRIRARVENMHRRRRRYRYSILGLILCRIGWAWERRKRYFCSQYVAEVLRDNGNVPLPKVPSLMYPCDFLHLDGIKPMFTGSVGELSSLYGPLAIR